jgi:hypothetical protein
MTQNDTRNKLLNYSVSINKMLWGPPLLMSYVTVQTLHAEEESESVHAMN